MRLQLWISRQRSCCARVLQRGLILLAAAVLGLAAGCVQYTPVGAPYITDQPLPSGGPSAYKLAAGDLLTIKFWGNAELNEDVPIRPDGGISLAYVGEVQAAGRTPAELDAELVRLYTGELARPRISVLVRDFGSQRVYVGGEVAKPGVIVVKGSLTVMQAVQEAGSFLPSARRKQVVLIRTDTDGKRLARSIDLRPVVSGEKPEQDVRLQALDVVFVPRTRINNVDLFMEYYVRQVLPVSPGLGFVVGGGTSHP
jgi:protein involved in polysaccharide export with SLBB domain